MLPAWDLLPVLAAIIEYRGQEMLPYVHIAGRNIPVYSLTAAAGIIAAVLYLKIMVRREAFRDLDRDLELAFLAALFGTAVGAKSLYLLLASGRITKDVATLGIGPAVYKYTAGGFVFFGGMIGCLAALYIYSRRAGLSFSHLMSLMLPAFPLAHAFGRFGCFAAGCCYGTESGSIISVTYTDALYAPNGVPLVPVQLMEAALELVFFVLLYRDAKKGSPGILMLAKYFLMYGCTRFILEFFRGDTCRGFVGLLSLSQVISLMCIGAGVMILKRGSEDVPHSVHL